MDAIKVSPALSQMNDIIMTLKASIADKDKLIGDLMTEIKEMRVSINAMAGDLSVLRRENEALWRDSYNQDKGKSPEHLESPERDMDYESNPDEPLKKGEGEQSDDARMTPDFQEARRKDKRRRGKNLSSDEEPTKKSNNDNPKGNSGKSIINNNSKSSRQTNKLMTSQGSREEFPSLPSTSSAGLTSPAENTKTPPKIVPRPTKVKAIPPIVISNAGKFVSISNTFRTNNIRYTSAVVVRNGIKVFPSTVDDYRRATQLLEENKEPFYTFRFPEDKLNHVVLRGVPTHLTTDDILADLESQGFRPKKVIRWLHANKRPMPMVLVLIPKSESNIYKVRVVCTFEVRAEAQKARSRSIQCYNCQDHGHAAPCCHVPAKCVKCGKDHHTSQCTKTKEEPPKCANCAGDHPASFSGCPQHPTQIRTKKQSNFRGWGTQDNSRLAPSKPEEPLKQVPKPDPPRESLLSHAQLAQIAKLFAEQMKSFMAQMLNKAQP